MLRNARSCEKIVVCVAKSHRFFCCGDAVVRIGFGGIWLRFLCQSHTLRVVNEAAGTDNGLLRRSCFLSFPHLVLVFLFCLCSWERQQLNPISVLVRCNRGARPQSDLDDGVSVPMLRVFLRVRTSVVLCFSSSAWWNAAPVHPSDSLFFVSRVLRSLVQYRMSSIGGGVSHEHRSLILLSSECSR